MCGRYYVESETWDIVQNDFPGLKGNVTEFPSGDIAPSMNTPALVAEGSPGLKQAALKWGFPGFRGSSLIINARAESVCEKPAFADSIRERRCVLPAAGFYEWDRGRQKVKFTLPDSPVIFLAGIFRPYDAALHFVIITREANESMLPVHDRMPLMIPPENVIEWINDLQAAKELLKEPMPELSAMREYEQLSLF